MATAYESIATITASGGETNLTFANISSSYSDLIFRYYLKATAGGIQTIYVRLNNNSSVQYSTNTLVATTSSQSSGYSINQTGSPNLISASVFTNGILEINNAGSGYVTLWSQQIIKFYQMRLSVGRYEVGGTPISQVSFVLPSNAFAAGSQITLYGIKRA